MEREHLYTEIVEGTSEVFTTMLMLEPKALAPSHESSNKVASHITSMIGLGGDIRGMLSIHFTSGLAKRMTSEFLGTEITELDDDVKDAVGEIANMVAGNLKISFEKTDKDIQLAIPTSILGSSLKTSGFSRAICILVPFLLDAEKFWIELKYVDNIKE